MGIIGPLLFLGAGALALIHRCDWFQICGNPFQSASAAGGGTTTTTSSSDPLGLPNTNDESSAAINATSNAVKKGCCVCRRDSNGDARCSRNGGAYTRYASAPQDLSKATDICYSGCSGSGKLSTTQTVRCPSGYTSVNGKCQKVTLSTKGGNPPSSSKSSSSNTPKSTSTVNPQPGTDIYNYYNANPKGYKPGGGTYFTTSYFSNIRQYPLYHRLAN